MYGSDPYGSAPYGSYSPSIKFDIDSPVDGKSILVISDRISKKLIEHFHANPQELKTMNHRLFEELVEEILKTFGYITELTKKTRDGGRDIIAIRHDVFKQRYLIECKRLDEPNKVPVSAVRELLGVKTHENATKGILVTTAHFTSDAKILLDEHEWDLEGKDFNHLQDWIKEYLAK